MLGRRRVKSKLLPLGSSLYAAVRSIGEALRARYRPPEEVFSKDALKSFAHKPVTLDQVKAEKRLAEMVLVRISRLSVQPVSEAEWKLVCKMGGL